MPKKIKTQENPQINSNKNRNNLLCFVDHLFITILFIILLVNFKIWSTNTKWIH